MVKKEVVDTKPPPLKLEEELVLSDDNDIGKTDTLMSAGMPHQVDNQSRRNEFKEDVNRKKARRSKLCLFPIVVVEKLNLSSLNSYLSTNKRVSSGDFSAPDTSPQIKQEPVDIDDLRADFVTKTGQPSLVGASSHSLSKGHSEPSTFGAKRKYHRLVKMESGTTEQIVEAQIRIKSSFNQNGGSSWHNECASNKSPALTAKFPVKEEKPIIHNLVRALTKSEPPAHTHLIKGIVKKGYIPCDLCGAQLKSKANLQGHFRNVHSNERPFSCQLCPRSFKAKSVLKTHLSTHSDERPFHCELCGASFKSKNGVLAHFSSGIHSSARPFACKLCPLRFAAKNNLMAHIGTHSTERPHSCKVCARGFLTKRYLLTHLKSHSDEKPYACGQCLLKFRYKETLQKHELSHEGTNLKNHPVRSKKKGFRKISFKCGSEEKPISFSNCSARCEEITDFRCHLKNHSTERPYGCGVCSTTYKTRKLLQRHVQTHSTEKRFHCAHCTAKFHRRSVLIAHLVTHSNKKPFVCDQCKKRFKCREHLRSHTKSHSDERPFSCEKCGARFKSLPHLKMHSISHSVEKPFTCDQCSVSFKREEGLKSHIQNYHTDRAVMSCKYCPAKFTQKFSYHSHVQTMHANRRPFSCVECNFRAETQQHLDSHLRIHSDRRPFPCKYCPARFKRRWCLKMHVLKVHRETPLIT